MTSPSDHVPGVLDEPLNQTEDAPDPLFYIAPIRDPRPQRAPTRPLLLEPSARRSAHGGHKGTAQLPAPQETHRSAIGTGIDVIAPERTVRPTDINSLIDPIVLEKPTRAPLPSFVSLAAVENKPPPLSPEGSRNKRARLDFGDILVPERIRSIQLPKPPEIEKKRETSYFPQNIALTNVNDLHEPPPNARLLPPIGLQPNFGDLYDVSGPSFQRERQSTGGNEPAEDCPAIDKTASETGSGAGEIHRKPRRRVVKWTKQETDELIKGVRKHHIGKWKEILEDPECHFGSHRTPGDLKDRFRTVAPESYKTRDLEHGLRESSSIVSSPNEDSQPKGNKSTPMRLENLLTENIEDNLDTAHSAQSSVDDTEDAELHRSFDEGQTPPDVTEGQTNPPKSAKNRRRRRLWTSEEDRNLRWGLERHGFQWTQMLSDPELKFQDRRGTDLRDRVRNMFPEHYRNAGFRPVRSRHANHAMLVTHPAEIGPSSPLLSPSATGSRTKATSPSSSPRPRESISSDASAKRSSRDRALLLSQQAPSGFRSQIALRQSRSPFDTDKRTVQRTHPQSHANPTSSLEPSSSAIPLDHLLTHSPEMELPHRDDMLPSLSLLHDDTWDNEVHSLLADDD